VNAFGAATGACIGTTQAPRCNPADYPYQGDGFKACKGWNNVVTVWRQNTITTTSTSQTGGIGRGFRWK
jgi:hypothetical protein